MEDVHTEHCCILHGCKYGEDDICTVQLGKYPQSYPCDNCSFDGIKSVEEAQSAFMVNNNPLLDKCQHLILEFNKKLISDILTLSKSGAIELDNDQDSYIDAKVLLTAAIHRNKDIFAPASTDKRKDVINLIKT